MKIRFTLLAALFVSQGTLAQGFFLPAGDNRLRDDITLLVDEGVINLPVNAWPLSRVDVADAVGRIDESNLQATLRATLVRVQQRVAPSDTAGEWHVRELKLAAGAAGLLRDRATLGREDFEISSMGGVITDRYSVTLNVTATSSPKDNQSLRLDGSEASVRWGNWIFSANQAERWWGPGHAGSLILSTNARPMPGLSLDRLHSVRSSLPILRWLGPWRFNAFMSTMEQDRADLNHPLFMGMRVSFKPIPIVELGFSRSAQFCGAERECGLGTFGRLLIGQDNVYRRGLDDPANEPGNQMAGMDLRIVSPFRRLPVAVYTQLIGEDNSDTLIPERYLAIFGGESWFMTEHGSALRFGIEYANTKAKWALGDVFADYAYRQALFFSGYRYHTRNIGHTTDADSETTAIYLSRTDDSGNKLGLRYWKGRLDHAGVPDLFNPLTQGRSTYDSVEFSWDGRIWSQELGAQVGYEHQSPSSAGKASRAFGFIQWRKLL
jgi:hypothetical protein